MKVILGLNRNSRVPLYRQFYESIRKAILKRQFPPGYRLLGTRQMAGEFGISRNTIAAAIGLLIAEGYLESRSRSGVFVSRKIPDDLIYIEPRKVIAKKRSTSNRMLPDRGRAIAAIRVNWQERPAPLRPFTPCLPSVAEFPIQIWARLASRRLRTPVRSLWNYGDARGYQPLREMIAAHLGAFRGVRCTADQVIIVSGTQQAVDLTARILLNPGSSVWVEDPGYLGTRGALLAAQAKLAPVPVDQNGIRVDLGKKISPKARLVCVTPSNQYPLGVTMSLERRLELLEWVQKSRAWIFEDDYDSEFRYDSRPLAALQGLDSNERVIYAGTFSKVLNPVLRLGYLVVPSDLIEAFTAAKAAVDRHSPLIEQMILADFLEQNHFVRHIRRMRNLYSERRQALISSIESKMSGSLEIVSSAAGLHLTVLLRKNKNDLQIARKASTQGIESEPLSVFYLNANVHHGLILGFAPFSEKEIHQSISKLASLVT